MHFFCSLGVQEIPPLKMTQHQTWQLHNKPYILTTHTPADMQNNFLTRLSSVLERKATLCTDDVVRSGYHKSFEMTMSLGSNVDTTHPSMVCQGGASGEVGYAWVQEGIMPWCAQSGWWLGSQVHMSTCCLLRDGSQPQNLEKNWNGPCSSCGQRVVVVIALEMAMWSGDRSIEQVAPGQKLCGAQDFSHDGHSGKYSASCEGITL